MESSSSSPVPPWTQPGVDRRRYVLALPWWDGAQWYLWTPDSATGRVLRPLDIAQSEYLAAAPARPDDFVIPFTDFLWQRASSPGVMRHWSAMLDDVHHFATCAAKVEHFFDLREKLGPGVREFVITELEYLLVLSRSLFDLAQETVADIWMTVRLYDAESNRIKKQKSLPRSFSKMIFKARGEPKSEQDLMSSFAIPPGLAKAYVESRRLFQAIRGFRDAIVHMGRNVDLIFVTEKGFCVDPTGPGFRDFPNLEMTEHFNEKLVSLKPLMATIVSGTIDACNRLFAGLNEQVDFAKALAPDYRVFIRSYYNGAFLRLQESVQGGSQWW